MKNVAFWEGQINDSNGDLIVVPQRRVRGLNAWTKFWTIHLVDDDFEHDVSDPTCSLFKMNGDHQSVFDSCCGHHEHFLPAFMEVSQIFIEIFHSGLK